MFFIWFFFRILGYFLVGTLFCTLTTELAKYKIGRLRPYFLTVCKPDMSDAICKVQGIIKEFWSLEPTLFVVPAFKAELYIKLLYILILLDSNLRTWVLTYLQPKKCSLKTKFRFFSLLCQSFFFSIQENIFLICNFIF